MQESISRTEGNQLLVERMYWINSDFKKFFLKLLKNVKVTVRLCSIISQNYALVFVRLVAVLTCGGGYVLAKNIAVISNPTFAIEILIIFQDCQKWQQHCVYSMLICCR